MKYSRQCRRFLIAWGLLLAGFGHAGEYRFSDSTHNSSASSIAVCNAFLKNLRIDTFPMVCKQRIADSEKDLGLPIWRPLNPLLHRNLLRVIWDARYAKVDSTSTIQATRDSALRERRVHQAKIANLGRAVRNGYVHMAVTQLPVGAEMRWILRLSEDEGSCDPNGWAAVGFYREYYIVDQNISKIDWEATRDSFLGGFDGYTNDKRVNLFLYKGKPHLSYWRGRADDGQLVISGDPGAYCEFDYTPK